VVKIIARASSLTSVNWIILIFLTKFLGSRLPALHTFRNLISPQGSSALIFFRFISISDNLMNELEMKNVKICYLLRYEDVRQSSFGGGLC